MTYWCWSLSIKKTDELV